MKRWFLAALAALTLSACVTIDPPPPPPPPPPAAVAISLTPENTGWRAPACGGITEADLVDTTSLTITSAWPAAADGRRYVEGYDVAGRIYVDVPNVTVRCNRILHPGVNGVQQRFDTTRDATGLIVEYNEVDGQNVCGAAYGIGSSNTPRSYTAHRNYVRGASDGFKVGGGDISITENLIDFRMSPDPTNPNYYVNAPMCAGDHRDGIQNSGTNSWWNFGLPILIKDNRILARWQTSTSTIILGGTLGPLGSHVVQDNFLSGGSYTVYAEANTYPIEGDISILNNVFERNSSGVYRVCVEQGGDVEACNTSSRFLRADANVTTSGNLWSNGALME